MTNDEPQPSRWRRGYRAVRERSGRVRERLRPQTLHAPSLDWLNFLIADVRGGLGPYVIVFLTTDRGWSPAAAGLVSTIGGWLGLVAQTPIGAWLDRAQRKHLTVLWALLALSVGALVIAWWNSFWPVLLANALMQVVSGVFEPAIAALTVGLFTRKMLTARMGRNAAWARAGNIAAAVLSGFTAWYFSPEAVFLQVPLISLATAIVAFTIPYRQVDARRARGLDSNETQSSAPQGWGSVFRNRAILVFGICSFLFEFADSPLLTLVGQKLGTDKPGAGLVLTSGLVIASQVGALAGAIVVGKAGDRSGYRRLLLIAFAVLPIRGALILLSDGTTYLFAMQVIGGFGAGLLAALTPIWLADVTAGSGRYNLSQGAVATLRGLGASTSALASELVLEYFGYTAAYVSCGVIGTAGLVLLWLGLPDHAHSQHHQTSDEGPAEGVKEGA